MSLLEEIKIPQCLKDTSATERSITLHTLSDATEKAYAAAVYTRHEYEDGNVTTRLNVGFWIRGQSREYKPFVAHRIGEICDKSNPDQWRYVPTDLNPADLGTRGMTARELTESSKWWNGPDFLHCPEAEWPDCKFNKPSREAMTELKTNAQTEQ